MHHKPRIAVYALSLVRDIKSHGRQRIDSLKHIKTKYSLDYKLFVDEDDALKQEYILPLGDKVEVIDIRKDLSPNLRKICNGQSHIGYKGMCLFYFSEYLYYLNGYDYAIRLDGDSIIHSNLFLDDFISSNKIHGYVTDRTDGHRETRETLPQAIQEYIRKNNIDILCKEEDINMSHFYSNFSIKKLGFWTSKPVVKFMNFIHTEDGIQKYRWGDHVLQATALKMFCPSKNIVKLDFKYEHGSHQFKNWEA
jgi:hypothetical protein